MDERTFHAMVLQRDRMAHFPVWRSWWRLKLSWRRFVWCCFVSNAGAGKRMFDVGVSMAAIVVLSPFLLLTIFLIKLEDGGPVFFIQKRVGRYGREFNMYKFRSMCTDAEKRLGPLLLQHQQIGNVTFKLRNDPRVTRIGRWMRRYSFDELPQLWNVLKGDMSLVGPRPPLPQEVALYTPFDRRRLFVQQGITCYWQISGRSEIQFTGQVKLDIRYIEEQSFFRDLWILLRTIPAVLAGKGAL